MKMFFSATSFVLFLALSVGLSSIAQANNFSPTIERAKKEPTITLGQAIERSSIRAKVRRPGLGSFTRRVQSRTRSADQQIGQEASTRSTRPARSTTRRLGGGRNGYARYLRSLETGNANKVSRLRRGRVTADQHVDTEANQR